MLTVIQVSLPVRYKCNARHNTPSGDFPRHMTDAIVSASWRLGAVGAGEGRQREDSQRLGSAGCVKCVCV
ncbi:hypothetical protein E2C01_029271 [Portunus trituberculatus]|uniref:Uncharacterized protein n=1 Tax=Portunus trituberculatus TaxID=210409 RepID=A0A5B7EU70_PORTR|nr:hypothetical protein [Portunus trituberculatus]